MVVLPATEVRLSAFCLPVPLAGPAQDFDTADYPSSLYYSIPALRHRNLPILALGAERCSTSPRLARGDVGPGCLPAEGAITKLEDQRCTRLRDIYFCTSSPTSTSHKTTFSHTSAQLSSWLTSRSSDQPASCYVSRRVPRSWRGRSRRNALRPRHVPRGLSGDHGCAASARWDVVSCKLAFPI